MAHTASSPFAASPIPDMPPRQEAFCRSVAHGASAAAAARAAGYSVDNARGQATRLLARPYVRRRIEELRDGLLAARNREVAELVAVARETLDKAREEGKLGAMLRAVELIAKLNGLFARQLPEIAHAALQPADGLLEGGEMTEYELDDENRDDDAGDDEGGEGGGGEGQSRLMSDEPDAEGCYPEDRPVMKKVLAIGTDIPGDPLLSAPPRYADGVAWDGLGPHPREEDPAFLDITPGNQSFLLVSEQYAARQRAAARRAGRADLIDPDGSEAYQAPAPVRRYRHDPGMSVWV
ncbi:terminase small subunit [Inquilinus sp. CAU 1745]|uniref:terminase small subunit n=1 Tax=Inquilinus sp. CAU 1745 TaxID=3140369 RepID=UPI00325BBEBE